MQNVTCDLKTWFRWQSNRTHHLFVSVVCVRWNEQTGIEREVVAKWLEYDNG